jgi:hypothetical protein
MALPVAIGFVWRAETFWGFVGRVGVSMVLGFCIWLGFVFLVSRHYDRKKRDESDAA